MLIFMLFYFIGFILAFIVNFANDQIDFPSLADSYLLDDFIFAFFISCSSWIAFFAGLDSSLAKTIRNIRICFLVEKRHMLLIPRFSSASSKVKQEIDETIEEIKKCFSK